MNPIVSFLFIYAVSWWMLLFMVLPFGAHRHENPDKNVYVAAPAKARLKQKLWIVSLLALIPAGLLQWALVGGHLRWVL